MCGAQLGGGVLLHHLLPSLHRLSSTPGHKPLHLGGLLESTGTRFRKEGRASGLAGLALEPLLFL